MVTMAVPETAAASAVLAELARSVFERGLVNGSAGNMSARCAEGMVVTPTGVSLGALTPDRLSVLDMEGRLQRGPAPSKEAPFHLAWYRANPDHGGIVHLHSPWAVALACLGGVNEDDVLPPLTPYQIMKIGRMPLAPYAAPGSPELTGALARLAPGRRAVLLANHGPVCGAPTLQGALDIAEEVEATARLLFALGSHPVRLLGETQVNELLRKY